MNDLLHFSIRDRIIEYPVYQSAVSRLERLHRRALASGQPGGLLVTGLSGAGKTTVRDEYERRFPKVDEGTVTCIPVLCVDTPAAPTVKNLAEAILIALGDPMSHRGSAERKTQRICAYLRLCKVEMLLIDEFQHFVEHGHRNEVRQVTDWLKSLINHAAIPVVLFGLPECKQVLQLNSQLARRFSAQYYLRPFQFESEEEIQEFRGVLHAVEQLLPLPSVPLSTPNMAQRFFYATNGLIDYICKITDGAVQAAHYRGSSHLDTAIYAEAFEEEVWREVSPALNPFLAGSGLRPLTRPGEPFALMCQPCQALDDSRDRGRRAKVKL